jgi:molybdopterin synthase sulfur carrier subunit
MGNLKYMINTKIIFLSVLMDITGNEETMISIDENSTIMDLLNKLINLFGNEFENTIFEKSELQNKYIIIGINGKDVRSLNGLNTIIQNGDEISIMPAIAGG